MNAHILSSSTNQVHGKSPTPGHNGSNYDSDADAADSDSDNSQSPSPSPSPTPTPPNTTAGGLVVNSNNNNSNSNNNNNNNNNSSSSSNGNSKQQLGMLPPPLVGVGLPQHPTNLSEWYVCQSAAGMPTPPSTEHSPIGLNITHLHHPTPSTVAY